jgi:hypothetical protein
LGAFESGWQAVEQAAAELRGIAKRNARSWLSPGLILLVGANLEGAYLVVFGGSVLFN